MRALPVVLLTVLLAAMPARAQQESAGHGYTGGAEMQSSGPAQRLPGDALEIALPHAGEVPRALACRIVDETVREFNNQLNPHHPPQLQLKIVLRLGQSHPYTKTLSGVEEGSEIGMVKWDPGLFARLVARAVRNSIFTENQLDRFAGSALRRAESQVTLEELKSAR